MIKTADRRAFATMSALGHKQTFAVQTSMSALPPKADICSALAHVRLVPIADIQFLLTKARSRSRNACNRRAWQMSLLREAS